MSEYPRREPPAGSILAAVEASLPIRLIATHKDHLLTADLGEPLEAVKLRNTGDYDHIPVVDRTAGEFRVVGLLDLPELADRAPQTRASDAMTPLSGADLIGGDGSILSFVRTAVDRPCRLVVSDAGVSGLVTLSDLQRLPVRACLFALITHLEASLAAAIDREFGGTTGWMDRLSSKRAGEVGAKANASRSGDGFVNLLLFTEFADKCDIVRKSPRFDRSGTQAETQKKAIRKLRDHVAHANDYADTRTRAEETCRTVKLIDAWLDYLADWPKDVGRA